MPLSREHHGRVVNWRFSDSRWTIFGSPTPLAKSLADENRT
jgi:hypothetical protein